MDTAATNAPTTTAGPGIALARDYYREVVAPILNRCIPGLDHAAARIGSGSDVLGLDDDMSTDHDWGLRLQLFPDHASVAQMSAVLDRHLPETFRGHPVRFAFTDRTTLRVGIDVGTVAEFGRSHLGFDVTRSPTIADWLSVSGQAALEVTAGAIFRDPHGRLSQLRSALAWYPDDLWLYLIACDWQRLDQELPLMGRAGHRGDRLGSGLIAARLVDTAVHLAFLLSRRWSPYAKWRGTVFAQLPIAGILADPLDAVLRTERWPDRDDGMKRALEGLAAFQCDLGLPSSAQPVRPFWDRPFLHLDPGMIPALTAAIRDDEVLALPVGLGSIDQRTDNVDVLTDPHRRRLAVGG